MSAEGKQGWWYRATTEQRLAQIDGGIELGMTATQVALNCGCLYRQNYSGGRRLGSADLLNGFALRHGRSFAHSANANAGGNGQTARRDGRVMSRKRAALEDAREAYFEGAEVDFWGQP